MRIAVTGIGIISAFGAGKGVNREGLYSGVSAITKGKWPLGVVHLTDEELKRMAGLDSVEVVSRNTLLGLVALRECLSDSALSQELIKNTVLINGTTVGGMDLTERYFQEWIQGNLANINAISQHEINNSTERLVDYCGMAKAITVSTACSSALNALIHGAMMLRSGDATQVVVGGTEALTQFHINGFVSLGILSKDICKPFASDRDGINLGEGAAYLVLENAEEAERRGVGIYGYIAGYGNRCDAYHFTASSPDGDGAYYAMSAALDLCGVKASDIEYVNAHGTATPNNDASEINALNKLFGSKMPEVESTKRLVAHTTSASGSIEAVFTLMRMKECGYNYAMSNSFGFGGNDSSVVLSKNPVDFKELSSACNVRVVADVYESKDTDWKPYLNVMQGRRLTPVMRAVIVAVKKALQPLDGGMPDAIVMDTRFGGLSLTLSMLHQMFSDGGEISPALFMLSTHNSLAGFIATNIKCNSFNSTYSHGAEACAELLIKNEEAKSVLVCSYDESVDEWNSLLSEVGDSQHDVINAKLFLCSD